MKNISSLFEQKEQEIIERVAEEAKRKARIEMKLFEFELVHSLADKKDIEKSVSAVRRYRDEKWKKALKLANRDLEKAESIFSEL